MFKRRMFAIWSNERKAWWRQNRHGYTRDPEEAGLFSEETAQEICNEANLIEIEEVMVPAGDVAEYQEEHG